MIMRSAGVLALLAGAGCAGALGDRPVVDPPAAAMSPEEPRSAESALPVVGAWTSVSLRGPGSASFRRIDLILHADGGGLFVGEGEDGVKAVSGRYAWGEGSLTLTRQNGTPLRFECRRDGPMIILKEGNSELRLAPIGP